MAKYKYMASMIRKCHFLATLPHININSRVMIHLQYVIKKLKAIGKVGGYFFHVKLRFLFSSHGCKRFLCQVKFCTIWKIWLFETLNTFLVNIRQNWPLKLTKSYKPPRFAISIWFQVSKYYNVENVDLFCQKYGQK